MDRCDEQIGLYRMKMSYKGVPKRNESVRDEGRIRSLHMSPLSHQENSMKGYYLDTTTPSNHSSNLACSPSCSNHGQWYECFFFHMRPRTLPSAHTTSPSLQSANVVQPSTSYQRTPFDPHNAPLR